MSEIVSEVSLSGRTKVTLGDIAKNVSENEYRPGEKGLDRCVGLEHLDPGSLQIHRWLPITPEMSFTRRFSRGQILFGKRRAYQKKVALADFDGICSSDILVIEAKKGNFVPELLPFIIQGDRFFEYAVGTSSGSLSPRTKWKFLAEYEIWLPSLQEQRRIATTLWAAEDCIVKGERFVAAAERAKQVFMRELFSNGIENKITNATAVGLIPNHWTIKKMGSFTKISTGGTPNRKVKEYWRGDVPWIKTGEIKYQTIFGTEEKISNKGLENSTAKIIPAGTLLMALYGEGVTRARVAITGIDAAINQACAAIFPEKDVSNRFLFHYLSYQYSALRSLGGGANQKNLNIGIIKNVLIPLPPLPEQRQIAGILTRCDETIAAARANVVAAKALKRKMINEMLSAESLE